MFQLIERQGERKAVHSQSDLDYMRARGWQPVVQRPPGEVEQAQPLAQPLAQPRVKRKYTRKAK